MSKDKTLATFQIDKSKWIKFKRLTGNQSASAVLVQFIEKFLDNPHILEQASYGETSNLEYQSITDSRIKALEDRLSIIETSDIEKVDNLAIQSISNLETRYKELENKLIVIEKSNTESVINSAIQSISNLEGRSKELEDKLTIIEKYNTESVTNSAIQSISNLESKSKELEQKLVSLEGAPRSGSLRDRREAITENLNKEEQEKIKERDKKVREALEQAESEGKVIKKQIYQRAAELLNQWEVLDKSNLQGKWTWTKVRDYFKK